MMTLPLQQGGCREPLSMYFDGEEVYRIDVDGQESLVRPVPQDYTPSHIQIFLHKVNGSELYFELLDGITTLNRFSAH